MEPSCLDIDIRDFNYTSRILLRQSMLKTKIGTPAGGIFLSGLQAVSETLLEFARTHLAANLLGFIANGE